MMLIFCLKIDDIQSNGIINTIDYAAMYQPDTSNIDGLNKTTATLSHENI